MERPIPHHSFELHGLHKRAAGAEDVSHCPCESQAVITRDHDKWR
jgi:hypothetical protein